MKKNVTKNYVYYDIRKSEKDKLIKEFGGQQIDPQKVYPGDSFYLLNDGRVVGDIGMGCRFVLFENMADYELFDKETTTVPEPRVKINDANFKNKIDLYVAFFCSEFNLSLNFNDINEVKKLDKLLNKLSTDDILKYKLGIIAIIIKFMLSNAEGTYLVFWDTKGQGDGWIIMSDMEHRNVILEGPVYAFEVEVFDKYAKGKKINFNKYVNYFIKTYNAYCTPLKR